MSDTHWKSIRDLVDWGDATFQVEMLHMLARHGADINIPSRDGKTPLMLAREAGSELGDESAEPLLAFGAKED